MAEDLEQGEMVELEDEDTGVRDTADGGAMVTLENEQDRIYQSEHFANIVDDIEPKTLRTTVEDLLMAGLYHAQHVKKRKETKLKTK